MSLRLTLISHAATQAVRDARFPADEPLEPLVLAKAAGLAGTLGRVDAAWTSPALRAVQTAGALGLSATVEEALRDIDLGAWAGRTLAEVEARDLALWNMDPTAAPHGGESILDLMARAAAFLGAMTRQEGRFVAVTHPAVIRAATLITLDAPPIAFWRIDVAPLCLAVFQARAGRWTLRSLGGR